MTTMYFIFILVLLIHTNKALEVASGDASIILRGTQDSPMEFPRMTQSMKESLVHLELTYVNFKPNALLESLRGCNKLETLILGRLNDSQWKFNTRILLPSLKLFIIDIEGYISKIYTEEEVKSIIFFDKNETESNWNFGEIYKMKTDIIISEFLRRFTGDGHYSNLFRIIHAEGILESELYFIEQLLKNLKNNFILKRLAIYPNKVYPKPPYFTELYLDPNWIPESVTHMTLDGFGVYVVGGNISTILNVATDLQQLDLSYDRIDISTLPTHSLRKLNLNFMREVNLTGNVKFEKLTTLRYFNPIPEGLSKNYSKIFPWVKYVSFWMGKSDKSIHFELLRNIVKTCAQIISLFDFNWGKFCDSDGWTGNGEMKDSDMVKLLLNAGVKKCATSFMLIKDNVTGHWNLTEYEYDYSDSFNAGIDVPDKLPGESDLMDCGKVNNYDEIHIPNDTPSTTEISLSQPVPSYSTCSTEGFFPDKNDCSRYYQCVKELFETESGAPRFAKYEHTCSPGTAFDTILRLCNHENQAETVPNCNKN